MPTQQLYNKHASQLFTLFVIVNPANFSADLNGRHIGPLQKKLTTLEEQVSAFAQHTSSSMKNKLALQIQTTLTTLGLEQQRIIEACHLNQTFECAYHEASNDLGPLLTTEEVAERLTMPPSNVDHAMRKAGFQRIRIPYANSGYPRIFWTQRDCEALKAISG